MNYTDVMDFVSKVVDGVGVGIIAVGAVVTTVAFIRDRIGRGLSSEEAYGRYRQGLGRSILIGLEFLIAGDIIRTIVVSPTFTNIGILAILVAIRSFLSIELQMEIEGHWPWQHYARMGSAPPGRDAESGGG